MSSYEYSFQEQTIFLGLSDGRLFQYKSKGIDSKSIFSKNKEPDVVAIESPNSHKGDIRKIVYTKMNDGKLDVLITASAD